MLRRSSASLPYSDLTVRAVDDAETIFHGYDDQDKGAWLGSAFTISPLMGANQGTVDSIKAALSIGLPPGSFVQFGLLSHPDVNESVGRYMSKKYQAKPLTAELTARLEMLYKNSTTQPIIRENGVLMNRRDYFVTIKLPATLTPSEREIKDARKKILQVIESIGATNIRHQAMTTGAYLKLLRHLHSIFAVPNSTVNEMAPIREQVFGPTEGIDFNDPTIMNFNGGEYYGKALSVKFFPQYASLQQMSQVCGDQMGVMNQITDPYYMVTTIHFPDQIDKADKIRNKSIWLNQQAFGPMLRLAPVLKYKKEGMDILIDEVNGKGGVACEVNFTIFMFSKDQEKLEALTSSYSSYLAGPLKFSMKPDSHILRPLWNELLPLNTTVKGIQKLHRFKTMGVVHACQFLPILGEWLGTSNASMMFTTRHNQIATFDLYDSDSNYNALICAKAGAGKSNAAQGMIRDYLAEGAKIWVVDNGDSYKKLNRSLNGTHIEFSNRSATCLNPFPTIDEFEEEIDILKATMAKMAAPNDGLDDVEMAVLEQAITATWQKYGRNASPQNVANWCMEQKNNPIADKIGKQLFPFTGGSFSKWFNGDNTLDMDNDFVLLELKDLQGRKDLQQVVLLMMLARINHDMFLTKGRKKLLFVDESWELLDDPMMEKALAALYRKVRKTGGSIIIITQLLADLTASKNSKAILGNSEWRFILAQEPSSVDDAMKSGALTSLDPYAAYLMKQVHTVPGSYSEIMIFRGNNYGIYRSVSDKFTNVMFSTRGKEFDLILDAIDRGIGAVDAVNYYIEHEAEFA